jgi:hypothetical protein
VPRGDTRPELLPGDAGRGLRGGTASGGGGGDAVNPPELGSIAPRGWRAQCATLAWPGQKHAAQHTTFSPPYLLLVLCTSHSTPPTRPPL